MRLKLRVVLVGVAALALFHGDEAFGQRGGRGGGGGGGGRGGAGPAGRPAGGTVVGPYGGGGAAAPRPGP